MKIKPLRGAESRTRRRYRLGVRAQRQADTRHRITEAALRLHEAIGPLRTSIAELAREAGVERPTVYRHFPDEISLLRACQEHWLSANPPPDPGAWLLIADPIDRLRSALLDLYLFYRGRSRMIDNLFRDAPRSTALSEVLAPIFGGLEAAADMLTSGFAVAPARRRYLRAAVGLAVAFETWRSLAQSAGLPDDDASGLMTELIVSATSR